MTQDRQILKRLNQAKLEIEIALNSFLQEQYQTHVKKTKTMNLKKLDSTCVIKTIVALKDQL